MADLVGIVKPFEKVVAGEAVASLEMPIEGHFRATRDLPE